MTVVTPTGDDTEPDFDESTSNDTYDEDADGDQEIGTSDCSSVRKANRIFHIVACSLFYPFRHT